MPKVPLYPLLTNLEDTDIFYVERPGTPNVGHHTTLASLILASLDSAVPQSRSISAGSGLTGGGNLSDDRTISLSAGSVASLLLADTAVQPARAVNTGTGLTGGGDLAADRTLALNAASIASLALADSATQPGDLAAVATSGAYADLSGLPSLGTAAPLNVAAVGNAAVGEVVKGNDTRLTDSRTPTGGAGGVLSGTYPNPGFAVDMATQSELDAHTSLTSGAHGISAFGATLVDDADAAAARTTLGLGTAATTDSADYATAAQGNLADTAIQPADNVSTLTNDSGYQTAAQVDSDVSTHAALTSAVHGISAYGATLVDDANAATARTTLELETVSQVEAEAGTATTTRAWTAQRVAQAIAALAAGGGEWWGKITTAAAISITAATTATINRMHEVNLTTAPATITLPTAVSAAGSVIGIKVLNTNTKTVTIDGNSTETIDGSLTLTMHKNGILLLVSDGSNWYSLARNLAPAVHVEASSDAGQVLTADVTNIQYEDVSIDTHGAWSTDTFTAPVGGVYMFTAGMQSSAVSGAVVQTFINGVGLDYVDSDGSASVNTYFRQWKLSAGDTVSFRSTLTLTRNAAAIGNRLSVTRVGD